MRFAGPDQADHLRKLAAIRQEFGCSPTEANEVLVKRECARRQEVFRSFVADIQASARTFEQVAKTLPQRQREMFLDLPLGAAVGIAIQYFAPRQRGRSCERRPRARTVRRRWSGRTARAGPDDDPPDESDIAAASRPTERRAAV
jgi:hypothetical protein